MVFNKEVVINLFKEHSYYFPNSNISFLALSHKELFNMYFPPSEISPPINILKNSFTMTMIDRASDKIKIQHEWGYTSCSFLFFTNEKKIIEGGKAVEYLLYGRVIKELTAKEAIFILNGNNYDLSLNDFHEKFINLKNKSLFDIFNEAIKSPKIDECVKRAFEEYKNKDNNFKSILEIYTFKIKEERNTPIDLENLKFEIGSNNHRKHFGFTNHKLNK